MKKFFVILSAACAIASLEAAPVISDISVEQNPDTKLVTVSYKLTGEAAVVTMSLEHNGAAVDGAATSRAFGDVSRRVEADASSYKTAYWQPMDTWANMNIGANGLKVVLKAWAVTAPPDYMVVTLDEAQTNAVRYYESAAAVPHGVTNRIYKTDKLVMRKIPAANIQWCMGRNASEEAWAFGDPTLADAERGHLVTLTADYYIGIYEFTQQQWATLTRGSWPSLFQGEGYPDYELYPVSSIVSGWNQSADPVSPIQAQLNKLNDRTGIDFTLPTEAQWEYACRAGSAAPINNGGTTKSDADAVAWHGGGGYSGYNGANSAVNGVVQPHPVGLKTPNAWGLYDMLGNVWEVCRDYWYREYSDGSPVIDPERTEDDPRATENGIGDITLYPRVRRGGDYHSSWSQNCRSTARWDTMSRSGWWGTPAGIGFRPVCTANADKVN
jgi:formylglycine-generating enzyme required for sulfatase activity